MLQFNNREKEDCSEGGNDAIEKEESPLVEVAEVAAAAADAEEDSCVCLEVHALEEVFRISTLRLDSERKQRDPMKFIAFSSDMTTDVEHDGAMTSRDLNLSGVPLFPLWMFRYACLLCGPIGIREMVLRR